MNCPSRTDPEPLDGWNQNPSPMAADITTRSDFSHMASARLRQDHKLDSANSVSEEIPEFQQSSASDTSEKLDFAACDGRASSIASRGPGAAHAVDAGVKGEFAIVSAAVAVQPTALAGPPPPDPPMQLPPSLTWWQRPFRRVAHTVWKFMKFIGPGFMIAVAYIDPGNYATDAAAGASYRFKLLFMILLSNILAIFLQALAIKLSTVTGLNLAEMNKAHCPPWLNYVLWFFGEAAIIATDIAEVIGFAIALNLLAPDLPIVAGCAISICDTIFILLFYRPESGSMLMLRVFEGFVMLLVIGVAICFCYQLSLIRDATVGEVFAGYLPSSALVQAEGLYQACGILGATVMPHSLYLGSGLNKPRLVQFDLRHNHIAAKSENHNDAASTHSNASHHGAHHGPDLTKYRPSLAAIRSCMQYSVWEVALSLFIFAMFINSAILIVCGASLSSISGADNADLFGIYDLLQQQLGPAAATVFAVALLLSGCSAGIVATMAGQMISEGQINWKLKPWLTRLITRSIAIVPSIIVAGTIGKSGLSQALVGSQVALSVILPVVSAPLIYYTSRNKHMTVWTTTTVTTTSTIANDAPPPTSSEEAAYTSPASSVPVSISSDPKPSQAAVNVEAVSTTSALAAPTTTTTTAVKMANNWITTGFAIAIWLLIVVMNVANIVLTGLGDA